MTLKVQSKSKISVLMAIIVGINAIIGAGIFSVPAKLQATAGPAGLLTYLFVIIAVLFIAALILFQFFNIPIVESDNVPTNWYSVIYWVTLGSTSVISGMLITVILMLYRAVTNLIAIIGLGKDHPMLSKDDLNDEIENEKEAMKS